MYTRCPHCHTLYRIQTEQLEAANGQARCCRCDRVFNALENLQATAPTEAATAPPAATGQFGQEPATPTGKHTIYQGTASVTEEAETEQITEAEQPFTEDKEEDSFLLDAADEVTSDHLFLSPDTTETLDESAAETTLAPLFKEEQAQEEAPPEAPAAIEEEEEDTIILDASYEVEEEDLQPLQELQDTTSKITTTEESEPPTPSHPPEEPVTAEEEDEDSAIFIAIDGDEEEDDGHSLPEQPPKGSGTIEPEQPLPFEVPEGLPEIEPSEAVDPFASMPQTGKGRGRLLWGVGSLLLILLLAGQLAWYQRATLMQFPQGKLLLEIACQLADCQLPQSRDPKLIKILNREIISHPTEQGTLLLRLVLANQAPFDQPYPLIELSLFTTDEKLVARRNFRPREYLPADRDSARLMQAGSSQYVEMILEDPGGNVTGFQFDFH